MDNINYIIIFSILYLILRELYKFSINNLSSFEHATSIVSIASHPIDTIEHATSIALPPIDTDPNIFYWKHEIDSNNLTKGFGAGDTFSGLNNLGCSPSDLTRLGSTYISSGYVCNINWGVNTNLPLYNFTGEETFMIIICNT